MSMAYPSMSRSRYTYSPTRFIPAFALVEMTYWLIRELFMLVARMLLHYRVIGKIEHWLIGGTDEAVIPEPEPSRLEVVHDRYRLVGTPWRKAPHVLGEERLQYDKRVREVKQKRERLESLLYNVGKEERDAIIKWIVDHNLNEFGDPKLTGYAGGHHGKWGPLINYESGESLTLIQYLLQNHPNRPWFTEKRNLMRRLLKDHDPLEAAAIVDWAIKNQLNEYGDPLGTTYLPNGPLFNLINGKTTPLYDYLCDMHPKRPWLDQGDLTQRVAASVNQVPHNASPQQFDYIMSAKPKMDSDEPEILGNLDDIAFLLDN